jgi:N-acetylglutamate synthase-like GNAT family acetyltransferase
LHIEIPAAEFMMRPMTPVKYQVRRATFEDLPALRALWQSMQIPLADLDKRHTEFQVAVAPQGEIVGALGLRILRQHGWLYHEAYTDFALADQVRPTFLERIRALASNHGVFRLWTHERAPFWTRTGFELASPEALKRLPGEWAHEGSNWYTWQLKDEDAIVSLEKELALFMESEKRETERAFEQARTIKRVATWIALFFGAIVCGAAIYLLLKHPEWLSPVH